MRFAVAILAVLITLTACDQGNTAELEARLAAVEETSAAAIEGTAEVLSAVEALTVEAELLRETVARPIRPSDIRIGDWSGLVVYTRSGTNVWIRPGACETPAEPVQVPAGETLMGTFHQAPTGPHCLSASEASPVGVTIDVQPGTIASVILPDEFEVVE